MKTPNNEDIEAEQLAKIISTRIEMVNPNDPQSVKDAVEFMRHPFGDQATPEQTAARRRDALRPVWLSFIRGLLYFVGFVLGGYTLCNSTPMEFLGIAAIGWLCYQLGKCSKNKP